jgi:ribonuclease-3
MTTITQIKKTFKDKNLLDLALTHRSWVNENQKGRGTNERLEFLGDAILEFVVSKELFTTFKEKEEGYLTALRANLVNTKNLSSFARKIDLGSQIYLSRGEEDGGGRDNSSLLADTVEAVIGAMFLDSGMDETYKFIKDNILHDVKKRAKMPLKDPKSTLQEKVQAQKLSAPKYKVVSESGPDHDKKFVIEVVVDDKPLAKGEGKNKSEAEQDAANAALEKM